MKKNLNNSQIDRQNILNNPFALTELESKIELKGIVFNDQIWFTTRQVAEYFNVETRTIRNYLDKHESELKQNGYKIFTGEELEQAKKLFGSENDFLTKTTVLGMFDFRSFLNIGMLLSESQKAKELRSLILDILIGVMNKNYGENRKYINQNDILYIPVKNRYTEIYHPDYLKSLNDCVDMGAKKFPYFNNMIFQFLFKEKYKEYRELLSLKNYEKSLDTLYTEIINTLSSFELAISEGIYDKFKVNQKKLNKSEVVEIFESEIRKKLWFPLVEFARDLMASRDYVLRDIIHPKLINNIKPLTFDEYSKFMSEVKLSNPLTTQEKKRIEEIQTQDLFEEFKDPIINDVFIRMNNK